MPPIAELPSGYELTVVGRRGAVGARPGGRRARRLGRRHAARRRRGRRGAGRRPTPVPEAASAATAPAPGTVVVEKQPSSFLLGTGPVLGAIGGARSRSSAPRCRGSRPSRTGSRSTRFGIPVRFLSGWEHLGDKGFALGWLIVILAGVGAVVSLISGGGIVRRILGLAIVIIVRRLRPPAAGLADHERPRARHRAQRLGRRRLRRARHRSAAGC